MDIYMRTQLVDKIIQAMREFEPNTIVQHNFLANLVEVKYGTNKYYGIVNSARKKLEREFNIFTDTESKKGYRILFPGLQQAQSCNGTVRRGVAKIFEGVKRYTNIDVSRIANTKEKENVLQMAQRDANMAGLLSAGGLKEQKVIEA